MNEKDEPLEQDEKPPTEPSLENTAAAEEDLGLEEPGAPEETRAAEDARLAEEREDAAVEREVRRLTRRGFVIAAGAVATGFAGWRWLMSRPDEAGLPRPFRSVLQMNEKIWESYYDPSRLSPPFASRDVTRPARINGHIGLTPDADAETWRLRIEGMAGGEAAELTLDEIRRLPQRTMITEFRCIEGWSTVVEWTGARLSDLMTRFPPPSQNGGNGNLAQPERLVRYVAMETPGRQYYVGLDMASALHPQTLLAWAINGEALNWHHGAPLRLAIPVKYGIKNIKRLATIRYTDIRPPDFWGDRGYDWYAGH